MSATVGHTLKAFMSLAVYDPAAFLKKGLKMKSLRRMLLSLFVLSLFLSPGCGDDQKDANEQAQRDLYEITEKIFALDEVSSGDWSLALVGNRETLVGDICGDSSSCAYSTDHFELLRKGENVFDRLDPGTQDLISKVNVYFSGDVSVYDAGNRKRFEYLNDINPELGAHELTLVRVYQISLLRRALYGNSFWPDAQNADRLEAFSSSDYTDTVNDDGTFTRKYDYTAAFRGNWVTTALTQVKRQCTAQELCDDVEGTLVGSECSLENPYGECSVKLSESGKATTRDYNRHTVSVEEWTWLCPDAVGDWNGCRVRGRFIDQKTSSFTVYPSKFPYVCDPRDEGISEPIVIDICEDSSNCLEVGTLGESDGFSVRVSVGADSCCDDPQRFDPVGNLSFDVKKGGKSYSGRKAATLDAASRTTYEFGMSVDSILDVGRARPGLCREPRRAHP